MSVARAAYICKGTCYGAFTSYILLYLQIDASKITFKEVFEKWSAEHYSKISRSNVNGYNASFKLCGDIEKMVFADIRLF